MEHIDYGQLGGAIGVIGGVIGSLIGLLAGAIGTYAGIKVQRGPRARAFAVRASVVVWAGVVLFALGMIFLPPVHKVLLVLGWIIAILLGIFYFNFRIWAIHRDEA